MPSPPDFSVDVLRHPGAVVVAPHGDVDMATIDELRTAWILADGELVLDLRGVGVGFLASPTDALGDGRPAA